MSYTIEYNRIALVEPKGTLRKETEHTNEHTTTEDELYLFVRSGDNNVYPRDKNWHLVASGWMYSVIQKVCEAAGYCEGGSIQMAAHGEDTKWISPEDYLKMYRDVLANPQPLTVENLKRHDMTKFSLWIPKKYLPLLEKSEYLSKEYEAMLRDIKQDLDCPFDDYDKYSIRLENDIENFHTWLKYWYVCETLKGFKTIYH